MKKFFDKFSEEKTIENIQKHNFDKFSRTICEEKTLLKEWKECDKVLKKDAAMGIKPIDELKIMETECTDKHKQYLCCKILQLHLYKIFINRQTKYFHEKNEKNKYL